MGNAASSLPSPPGARPSSSSSSPSPPGARLSSSSSPPSPPGSRTSSCSSPPSLPGAGPSTSSSPPSPPPPPLAALPEELVEDILLRFPPDEPASLLRAALVCKPWGLLISGPRFRRRYHELHRTPPVLGYLCNTGYTGSRFVPTTAFSPPGTGRFDLEVLDTNHGRVLGRMYVPVEEDNVLVVWDPIADEQWVLPFPPQFALGWTAAVVCAGTATGSCNHLDCNRGPFLVVFVGLDPSEMFVCTYSSDVNAWSEPISTEHPDPVNCNLVHVESHPAPVGNTLCFGIGLTNLNLKYNLDTCEMSLIQLPSTYVWSYRRSFIFTTTEEGVLGLIAVDYPKLCIWLMKDAPEVDAGWTQSRVIDLKTTVLPPCDGFLTSANVVGVTDGLGTLFMMVETDLYTIDLKTCMVELCQYPGRGIEYIVPYMSFYTPELEAACAGEGPSEGRSSA